MEELIRGLTTAQRRNLLDLDNWCNRMNLSMGRGARTGRILIEKGLAYKTGEIKNHVDQYRITALGSKVAEKIRHTTY